MVKLNVQQLRGLIVEAAKKKKKSTPSKKKKTPAKGHALNSSGVSLIAQNIAAAVDHMLDDITDMFVDQAYESDDLHTLLTQVRTNAQKQALVAAILKHDILKTCIEGVVTAYIETEPDILDAQDDYDGNGAPSSGGNYGRDANENPPGVPFGGFETR